jgi:hypothetical protein
VPRTTHPTATTTAGSRTLCGEDHLEHLVGIFEEILEFVALRSKHLLCQLRGDFDSRDGGIFGHVANFIHLDTGIAGQRGLQLLGQRGWFGVSTRESAHKSRELRLRQCR